MIDKFKNIKCESHYLRKLNKNYDSYMKGLCDVLEKLDRIISEKEMKELLSKKLQLGCEEFNESQYIQSACELTAMSQFVENESIEFFYEKKVTPPKNVDFSFIKNMVQYNVEVKCPSYKPKTNSEGRVIFTNRASNISDKNSILTNLKGKLETHNIEATEGKNLDNTLKDFLVSTQAKVKDSCLQNVTILLVCCNDEIDMNIWRGYLFSSSGFFTENSFINHEKFNRVDYVLLTNIYNRHYKYYDESLISNHWKLASSFNLLYPNKYSKRNRNIIGHEDLENMNSIFPNHNINFEAYMKDHNDIPTGESSDLKEPILGISWYTEKLKEKDVYYFSSVQ